MVNMMSRMNRSLMVFGALALSIVAATVQADEAWRDAPPPVIRSDRKESPPKPKTKEIVSGPVCEQPALPVGLGPPPTLLGLLLEDPITDLERSRVYAQIEQCKRNTVKTADPFMVLALLRYEETLGIPEDMRGILGATWCIEAALRTESARGGPVRGDPRNGVSMASGPFQLWPWQRKWCGFGHGLSENGGADNLFAAAQCYWGRVADRYDARVAGAGCKRPWVVAEALGANGPKYLPYGCSAESKHHQELKRWVVAKD